MSYTFENIFPSLKPFFQWCAETRIGIYIHTVTWAFPLIETIHILALVVLLGSILLVNLRMCGILRGWSVAQIRGTLKPFILAGLAAILITGILLFLSDPFKYYFNEAFGPKIFYLVLAILYQFTLFGRAASAWPKLAACLSFALWFAVGAAGRAIGWV